MGFDCRRLSLVICDSAVCDKSDCKYPNVCQAEFFPGSCLINLAAVCSSEPLTVWFNTKEIPSAPNLSVARLHRRISAVAAHSLYESPQSIRACCGVCVCCVCQ